MVAVADATNVNTRGSIDSAEHYEGTRSSHIGQRHIGTSINEGHASRSGLGEMKKPTALGLLARRRCCVVDITRDGVWENDVESRLLSGKFMARKCWASKHVRVRDRTMLTSMLGTFNEEEEALGEVMFVHADLAEDIIDRVIEGGTVEVHVVSLSGGGRRQLHVVVVHCCEDGD